MTDSQPTNPADRNLVAEFGLEVLFPGVTWQAVGPARVSAILLPSRAADVSESALDAHILSVHVWDMPYRGGEAGVIVRGEAGTSVFEMQLGNASPAARAAAIRAALPEAKARVAEFALLLLRLVAFDPATGG